MIVIIFCYLIAGANHFLHPGVTLLLFQAIFHSPFLLTIYQGFLKYCLECCWHLKQAAVLLRWP